MRVLLAVWLLAAPAFAADFLLNPGQSIQAAINAAAVSGDRILLQPGTYTEAIDFKGKAIELIGLAGAQATVIDATGLFEPVVSMHAGEGPGSKLRGVTLTGGFNQSFGVPGGGLSGFGFGFTPVASPTIEDCIVRDNTAMGGGGIAANATIRRTSIYGNVSALLDGGGVYGAVTMEDCIVADNLATDAYGGGVAVHGGLGILSGCVIVENESFQSARGGGVYVASTATGVMLSCLVTANHVDGLGASGWGGGVFVELASSGFLVDRCTVVKNTTTFFGVTNDVGGIMGPVVLRNSIVRGNDQAQVSGLTSVDYSNVEGGAPGTGNIDLPAQFVDDSPARRDFHLEAASPCIDAGDPLALDPDGTRLDMGAYAFQTFYARVGAIAAEWMDPSWPEIVESFGGKSVYTIHGGAGLSGDTYVILGSLSGTAPGTPVLGVTLPLVLDAFLLFTANHMNQPPYAGSSGVLDANGTGTMTFTVPASVLGGLAGTTAWHAGIVVDTSALVATLATNAETVEIIP